MVDLRRLFRPTSIAVVGATPREETYAYATRVNLRALGYRGRVTGVHPHRRSVAGFPCVRSLDLDAAAQLAAAAGSALLEHGLALVELNPVLVHERGATAVDAVARW
jgi:mRNA-degrading endonuclease toxin of MazEF toxin-antitoxin module